MSCTCLIKCWPKFRRSSRRASAFAPLREASELGKVPGVTSTSSKPFSSEVELPKLRPPSLKNSVELYLEYTRPLVSPEQWQKTVELSDWWLASYLRYRLPVPIHSNPAFWLPPRSFASDAAWLSHAACMVSGALKYKVLLDHRQLPVDKTPDGASLCMAQNYAFFGNCRKTGFPQDSLRYRYGLAVSSLPSRYICVLIKNNFYLVQVLHDITNEPLPTHIIFQQLQSVVLSAIDTAAPVGLFTTLPRDDWFKVYTELSSDPINMNTLTAIEASLFLLCLDTSSGISQFSSPASVSTHLSFYDSAIANNCLHGVSSSAYNAGNRWFDKTQFIVSRDGVVGLNFEHAPFDGHVAVAVLEAALAETPTAEALIQREAEAAPRTTYRFCSPQLLAWNVSASLYGKLEKARALFDAAQCFGSQFRSACCDRGQWDQVAVAFTDWDMLFPRDRFRCSAAVVEAEDASHLAMDTDVACARFTPFSRSWMKSARLSPDAFVQIGLQLAYARLHPNRPPPATYESGTLRRFRLGRTETIRSCSAESVAFTKAMADDTISDSQKCKILRKAIEQHQRYTKMAVSGNGFDRHLLGLRLIAADSGQQTPSFFIDPTYGTANHFLLSTSQITGRQDFGVSFGPVSPDGYGFCYNLQGHHINLMASAFKSKTPNNSARNLLISFAASLLDMRRLLESSE
ncbi:unnamed protein product [Schistocephalus solidus]|uniref:Carn_acyltransf domain-containing protein n=1 Tax=Schistocephalus solidus TaxID=70667 RepID=A0A183T1C3_SCHSO|nr:unnamed protein product [Schistocephalus solidus]